MLPTLVADLSIDITRDTCPMTFVRTRLALDRLAPGQVLQVRLSGDEPRRSVPATAAAQGHETLGATTDAAGVTTLLLRKGAAGAPMSAAIPASGGEAGRAGPRPGTAQG